MALAPWTAVASERIVSIVFIGLLLCERSVMPIVERQDRGSTPPAKGYSERIPFSRMILPQRAFSARVMDPG